MTGAGPGTGATRSAFWRSVGDTGPVAAADAELGGDVAAAARLAWQRDDVAVAFRRNRELVDVAADFRWFTVDGVPHVAKARSPAKAARERERAAAVAGRLRAAGSTLRVAVPREVPVDGERVALVLPDLGHTLAEHALDGTGPVLTAEATAILDELLGAGVVWRGFAPRNICRAAGGGFVLLDLEHAGLDRTGAVDALAVQFWCLDWVAPDGDPDGVPAAIDGLLRRHGLGTERRPPDAYERRVADLIGTTAEEAQRACAAATRRSWRALPPGTPVATTLTPGEICHLLDEVLPMPEAVRATLALAAVRDRDGDRGYAATLGEVEGAVRDALAAAGAATSLRVDQAAVAAALADRLREIVPDPSPARRASW